MKTILTSILIFSCHALWAQPQVKELKGSINMPALSKLDVKVGFDNNMDVKSWEGLVNGKDYARYADINVKSNRPWIVTVAARNPTFTANTASGVHEIPVNTIMLKRSGSENYITLSNKPQVILRNENTLIQNHYTLDLKLQPQFGYFGGKYDLDMVFVLTPQ